MSDEKAMDKPIAVGFWPCIAGAIEQQYDRYCKVQFSRSAVPVGYEEYINMMLVKGICAYEPVLIQQEAIVKATELLSQENQRLLDEAARRVLDAGI